VSWEEIKLQVSDELKQLLKDRSISENELKRVIHHAETEGDKLYQPEANIYLTKLTMGLATFYVEYSIEEDGYLVRAAYAHRSRIVGE